MRNYQRHYRLSILSLCAVPALEAASTTGFPGTLPSPYSVVNNEYSESSKAQTAATGASSDDDEYILHESSDFDEEAEHESLMESEGEEEDDSINAGEEASVSTQQQVSGQQPVQYAQHYNEEESSSAEDSPASSSSQPLKTLKKLQHMLDSTDYMTVSPSMQGPHADVVFDETESFSDQDFVDVNEEPDETAATSLSTPAKTDKETKSEASTSKVAQPPSSPSAPQRPEQEQLWTSKDRSKYKKQQQRLRIETDKQRRRHRKLQSLPIHPNSSDDDMTDPETEGDGLGYALPNLPVYFTDDEGGTTTDGLEIEPPTRMLQQQSQQQQQYQQQAPPPQQQQAYNYPSPPYPYPDQAAAQPPPYVGYPPTGSYPMPYPYGAYNPQQQQQQQQQMYAAQQQQAAAWAASAPHYGQPLYPPWSRSSYRPQVPSTVNRRLQGQKKPVDTKKSDSSPGEKEKVATSFPAVPPQQSTKTVNNDVTVAEAGTMVNFDSVQKLSILAIGAVLLCYCAVSPRTLELVDYNLKFKENMSIVYLAFIAPVINFLFVFDARANDINAVVSALYTSATVGYCFAFILELVLTTFLRLGVFLLWEPNVFDLTPKVPALVLPWVLRENKYRPKRITLFVADFVTSCVAAPIVEEYIKLKILQLSGRLPKNFKWTTKKSAKKGRKKRRVAEAIQKRPGEREVVNINNYVTEMLAASLGIKLFDSVRRILMYTKDSDENKGFYAFCRGIFPIHELCGTMTALSLAKRDVLGVDMPLWRILAPAVVIHGMANFRGKKPLFKWNSATPWSEMQLSPWNVADDSTFSQLLSKGFAKLMWLVILGRVLGYCIKNYYLISRQAVKRTTTYAGRNAAFSAELEAAEMLKKSKEK